jgi:hypothetical protein
MTIVSIGSIHWRPTPDDPFDDLTLEAEEARDEADADRVPPAELDGTVDDYAADQLLLSLEHADGQTPEPPEGL